MVSVLLSSLKKKCMSIRVGLHLEDRKRIFPPRSKMQARKTRIRKPRKPSEETWDVYLIDLAYGPRRRADKEP